MHLLRHKLGGCRGPPTRAAGCVARHLLLDSSGTFGSAATPLATASHRPTTPRATRRASEGLEATRESSSAPSATYPYPHVPVLLKEVLDAFQPVSLKTYVDCTLGAGGHASEIVGAHPELKTLIGIDLDPTAHAVAEPRIRAAAGVRDGFTLCLLQGNYSDLKVLLRSQGSSVQRPDGILMDLGVSSMQIDTAERGFSFLREGPLDMRMDPGAVLSAEEVLNTWSEVELGRIIRDYGEEKLWKVVARRLVQAREVEPIRTTSQLVKAIGQTQLGSKGGRKGAGRGVHPATRTFQALRIAVNDELHKLEKALPEAIDSLGPGGRLAVISFHSLEDRIVKHAYLRAAGKTTPEDEHLVYGPDKYSYLEQLEANKIADIITRKPVVPSDGETEMNVRARSAKLRVLQKLG